MDSATNPSPGFQRNPGYRITVEPFDGVVNVTFSDAIIASSDKALALREGDYPPIFYIPFKDIYFNFLQRTDSRTHCPYKGDASYWGATAVGESEKDIMWAYENPYDEMQRIRNHGAFYPNKVGIEALPRTGAAS